MLEECPVETYQNELEFEGLYNLVKSINPTKIVEIGSLYGGTLWFWMRLAKPQSKFMVIDDTVDKFDPRYKKQIYCQNRLWYEWANDKDHQIQVMNCHSQDPKAIYTAYLNMNPVDFLSIVWDHAYNIVKSDFLAYYNLVRPGGVIAVHNIAEDEINKFWMEILNSQIFRTVEFIEDRGIGVIYV